MAADTTAIDPILVKKLSPALLKYIQQARAAAAAPSNPLEALPWLQELATLDASSEEALSVFLAKTYIGDTKPIPLGSHKGISYFLETAKDDIPQRGSISLTPLESMRGVSDYVKRYEYELLPDGGGPRPDLRFGFGLGYVMYQPPKDAAAKEDPALASAGLFAVYNVVDKSVWMTVDMRPFENAATDYREDSLPSTWGLLSGDDTKQIGTMRISQEEWWKKNPPAIVSGDPFTTFPSYSWQLVSKPAVLSDFLGLL